MDAGTSFALTQTAQALAACSSHEPRDDTAKYECWRAIRCVPKQLYRAVREALEGLGLHHKPRRCGLRSEDWYPERRIGSLPPQYANSFQGTSHAPSSKYSSASTCGVVEERRQFLCAPLPYGSLLLDIGCHRLRWLSPATIQQSASSGHPSSGRSITVLHDRNNGLNCLSRMRAREIDKRLNNLWPTARIARPPTLIAAGNHSYKVMHHQIETRARPSADTVSSTNSVRSSFSQSGM